jgi:hypothetical protein
MPEQDPIEAVGCGTTAPKQTQFENQKGVRPRLREALTQ